MVAQQTTPHHCATMVSPTRTYAAASVRLVPGWGVKRGQRPDVVGSDPHRCVWFSAYNPAMDMLRIIQTLVAPVVMISACGLLALAFYNRLAAIVGRARAFAHERYETRRQLRDGDDPDLAERLNTLEEQVGLILRRARLIRAALYCLLVTVLLMLGCSLCLGMSLLVMYFQSIALFCFLAGVGAMMGGIVFAMLELRHALDPVAVEHATLRASDEPGDL